LTISNTTTITGGINISASAIINGAYDLEIGAGIFISSTFNLSGTATIVLNGTGTWTTSATTNTIANKLTINTSGTITIATNAYYITGVLTLTSGTISGTITLRGPCSLIGTGVTGLGLTFAVTGTYTLTGNLTVGALTITTATTFSGVYTIACSTLLFNAAATHTLTGNVDCSGTLTINTGAAVVNGSGKTIYVGGNLTLTAQPISGTANIILDGTGTWSASNSVGRVNNNLTINTAGTITCGANIYYATGTLTYTAGTVNVSTSNTILNITGSSTLDISGKTWRSISFSGTMTLLSDITTDSSGTVTISGTTALTASGGSRTLTVGRHFTVGSGVSGTTDIVMSGPGTWSGSGTVSNDLTIPGTLTISATVSKSTGDLRFTGGPSQSITTTGSTLSIAGSFTLNSHWITWNNVTFNSGQTVTLDGDLNCATLSTVGSSVNPACVFAANGSYDITCTNLILGAGGGGTVVITPSLKIPNSQTLTVNTAITSGQALPTSTATISSGTATVTAYLIYNGTRSNLKCTKTIFTDIDASGGNTIFNYRGGTLTRTVNIVNLDSPTTLSVAS
jgi:hypothetical protein